MHRQPLIGAGVSGKPPSDATHTNTELRLGWLTNESASPPAVAHDLDHYVVAGGAKKPKGVPVSCRLALEVSLS